MNKPLLSIVSGLGIFFLAVVLASLLPVSGKAVSDMLSLVDEDAVRNARLDQNAAIAAKDLERVAMFWTDDVTIRRGLGTSVIGKEAYRVLMDDEVNEKHLFYVREPEQIEISAQWPLAYESGIWTARRGSAEGTAIIRGRYAAQWVKRMGNWYIRSEVFVALSCCENGCDLLALP